MKSNNRQMRKDLQKKGFHVYNFLPFAKIMAFVLSRINIEVYWVFAEPFGFMVLNCGDFDRINKARQKNGVVKLRTRNLNNMAIFRTPKKSWGILKIH